MCRLILFVCLCICVFVYLYFEYFCAGLHHHCCRLRQYFSAAQCRLFASNSGESGHGRHTTTINATFLIIIFNTTTILTFIIIIVNTFLAIIISMLFSVMIVILILNSANYPLKRPLIV